jgi:hypothetical protein
VSHLINNELIWVSIPKCASYSIEQALRNSKLKLEMYDPNTITDHYHVPLNECLLTWGNKETICITRDWVQRWISALNFIWDKIEFESEYTPIRKWEDVDNKFLYKSFDTNFLNNLHLVDGQDIGIQSCFLKLVKENYDPLKKIPNVMITLISQKYFLSNKKCTYEFDIKEIDKFTDFIEERFGERLIIENTNQSTKRANKIVIDDKLKQWIWENFEKRFEKRNQLI